MLVVSLEPACSLEVAPTFHEPFWLHWQGHNHKQGGQYDAAPCAFSILRIPECFVLAIWASKGNTQVFPSNMRVDACRALSIKRST